MLTPKLLLNPKQQAADEFAAARRRVLTSRDRLLLTLDQTDAAYAEVKPTDRPADQFLTAVQAALAADDYAAATSLLRDELASLPAPGGSGGPAQRPRRKRLSDLAHILSAMML